MPITKLLLFLGASGVVTIVLVAVATAFVLAVASWYLVEEPSLSLKV